MIVMLVNVVIIEIEPFQVLTSLRDFIEIEVEVMQKHEDFSMDLSLGSIVKIRNKRYLLVVHVQHLWFVVVV